MEGTPARFARAPEAVTRSIAGETLVVPVVAQVGDLESIYTLNEVASRIWDLIDGRRGTAEIAEVVSRDYEVTAPEAARDVSTLLAALESAGLVRAVPA